MCRNVRRQRGQIVQHLLGEGVEQMESSQRRQALDFIVGSKRWFHANMPELYAREARLTRANTESNSRRLSARKQKVIDPFR